MKTTANDAATPFFVSANEVEFARERADQFRLYRLYHFCTDPKFFELPGVMKAIAILIQQHIGQASEAFVAE